MEGCLLPSASILRDDRPVDADVDELAVFLAGWGVERYSKSQVKRAGEIIVARNEIVTDEVRDAFYLAHAWRNAHIVPLRAARKDLKALARRAKVSGQAVGRLKRFQSIRRKLRRRPLSLYQMQDIAGVRIIVDTMAEVEAVAARYRLGQSKHELLSEDDYIAAPKRGGYRSVHFSLKHVGDEHLTAGNRLTVEVQIRTRLQHAWATAVEAVGTVRSEELKGGVGDADWLRLFAIMSAEFALEEGCPLGDGVPSDLTARRTELVELEQKLKAVATLESYRNAIREISTWSTLRGNAFIISYNNVTRRVSVRTNSSFAALAVDYETAEALSENNAVLVEVDKVDDLTSAYPNYFLDVEVFSNRLRQLVGQASAPIPTLEKQKSMSEWMAMWVLRSSKWKRR